MSAKQQMRQKEQRFAVKPTYNRIQASKPSTT